MPMLRLRQQIEQAHERPWLRFLVVLALAVLLVFTVAHLAHDVAHDDGTGEFAAAVCIAIVFTFALLGVRPQAPAHRVAARSAAFARPRDPPFPPAVFSLGVTPLRR